MTLCLRKSICDSTLTEDNNTQKEITIDYRNTEITEQETQN